MSKPYTPHSNERIVYDGIDACPYLDGERRAHLCVINSLICYHLHWMLPCRVVIVGLGEWYTGRIAPHVEPVNQLGSSSGV